MSAPIQAEAAGQSSMFRDSAHEPFLPTDPEPRQSGTSANPGKPLCAALLLAQPSHSFRHRTLAPRHAACRVKAPTRQGFELRHRVPPTGGGPDVPDSPRKGGNEPGGEPRRVEGERPLLLRPQGSMSRTDAFPARRATCRHFPCGRIRPRHTLLRAHHETRLSRKRSLGVSI